MTQVSSYPKVYNLGKPELDKLFDGPVLVEEKVDGSQLSIQLDGDVLKFRSKGATINPNEPNKMFKKAVEYAQSLSLPQGFIFRGECLNGKQHNKILYDDVPPGNFIVFDIQDQNGVYLDYDNMSKLASDFGLMSVPAYFFGEINSMEELVGFMERKPILGGTRIEGIVIKNYAHLGVDGKPLFGKLVSDEFRETMNRGNKKPKDESDIATEIGLRFGTEARWEKAVQHLNDDGRLPGGAEDIGPLIKEVIKDVLEEESGEIKQVLFDFYAKQIKRELTRGIPGWYKMRMAESSF